MHQDSRATCRTQREVAPDVGLSMVLVVSFTLLGLFPSARSAKARVCSSAMAETYQILVRLLDGRTHCLRFATPTISGGDLLAAVSSASCVPTAYLRLVSGRASISPSSILASSGCGNFPSACALLRLRGGKGGFGSLLRGAASKAGQKKTSNFDACRDMSGRRLRHVNAERRLEEWRAEAADRQLEKLAEDFIRKKAKEAGRGGGAAEVDKYLEKYRKDAERCVGVVEESVRASLGKRKAAPKPPVGADAKKLKIWLGKNKVEDSESDSDIDVDDDEDSDGVKGLDAKSEVLDEGNCSNGSNKSEEKLNLPSDSVSHSEGESSVEKPRHSDSEVKGYCVQESPELAVSSGSEHGNVESDGSVDLKGGVVDQPTSENGTVSSSQDVPRFDGVINKEENSGSDKSLHNKPEVTPVEESAERNGTSLSEEPLDLTKYSSAAGLELLGLERLKLELQTRGIKCGGTLQERAARLYLLKTIPLEELPKKLLAKPVSGGK